MIVGYVGQGRSQEYLEMLDGLKKLEGACSLAGLQVKDLEQSLNVFRSSYESIAKPLYASIYGNNKAYHHVHHSRKFRVRKKWLNRMLRMLDQQIGGPPACQQQRTF